MKGILSVLALVTLSVVACGGDDDDDGTGDEGGASTGATGSGGEPASSSGGEPASSGGGAATGAGGEPSSGNVSCDPEVDGVCQNPMDCEFVASGEARMTAGTCGQTCLLSGDMSEECPVTCLLDELDMSEGCADCYAAAAVCGIMNCAAECFANPEAEVCQSCLVDAGCRADFNDCSGLEQ